MTQQGESTLQEFLKKRLTKGGSKRQSLGGYGPLPIIIGITGHRDVRDEDIPKLEEILRSQFDTLRREYPSTPFVILSALADGADLIGARVALEAGHRLIVPIPMPLEMYELEFSATSLVEFRRLCGLAEHVFELPVQAGMSDEDLRNHGPNRDWQYAQLGAYLARNSEILIAFWNGIGGHLPGGTAQIVHFKLDGVPEPYAPPHSELDAPDSGVVYHIVTPRKSNSETRDEPLSLHKLYPPGFDTIEETEKAYYDIYERMNAFNEDALRHAEELAEHREQSKEYLFPAANRSELSPMLNQTVEFYSIADVLSQHFQKHTISALKVILSFVFVAALSYDLYSHLFDETQLIMGLYLGMFFLSYLWHVRAAKAGYQTSYLDYRALAEGLRVQFFWKLAGLKDSVADFYMRKQKSELDWVRNAVRSSMTETCEDSIKDSTNELPLQDRLAFVLKHWVDDQAKYFARAAHRDHERLHKHEHTISVLFGLTLLFAALQLMLPANPVIIIVIGLFPVIAALIHTFVQKNALMEHSKQYDRMSVLFHRARIHLAKLIETQKLKEAQDFINELGREALYENGDWVPDAPRATVGSSERSMSEQLLRSLKAVAFFVEEPLLVAGWYRELLDTDPVRSSDTFVMFYLPTFELIFHQRDAKVGSGSAGVVPYFQVEDIAAAIEVLLE